MFSAQEFPRLRKAEVFGPLIGLNLLFLGPAAGEVLLVPEDFETIQMAIDAASDADVILVGPGVYHETIDLLGKAITVRSEGGADATTIDGTGLGGSVVKCVSGEGADTTLDGFTITGGDAVQGGGMLNIAGSPTVAGCVFQANIASDGGAMFNFDADPIVVDCRFIGNVCELTGGGGVHNDASSPCIVDCVFLDNAAVHAFGSGGGVYSRDFSEPHVQGCLFAGNTADFNGGGMYSVNGSSATVVSCSFHGNAAKRGGGMHVDESEAEVVNCLLSENFADESGGGLRNFIGFSTVVNCTFTGNKAVFGGGVANHGSTVGIGNTILWKDGATVGSEIHNEAGGTVKIRYCDIQDSGGSGGQWDPALGLDGGGNIDADPLFVNPVGGEYRLAAGSPCIDAADNTAVPEGIVTDLAGRPRFVDDEETEDTGFGQPPIVDMGAYERQPAGCPADVTGDEVVDVSDLLAVLAAWGSTGGEIPEDVNADGIVDVLDVLEVLASWGPC